MGTSVKSTRMTTLAGWLLGGFAAALLFQRLAESLGGRLPGVPWLAVAGMVIVSIILLLQGWPIRAWASGDHSKEIDQVQAARVLVFAKTAAVAGALLLGWYLGAATYLLSVGARTGQGLLMFVPAVTAGAMAGVGLLVEWFCQLPPDDGEDVRQSEPSD